MIFLDFCMAKSYDKIIKTFCEAIFMIVTDTGITLAGDNSKGAR